MVLSGKPSIGGWRYENYLRYGEEIMRHTSSVWFCDLEIGLGEITIVLRWRWFNL